MTDSNLSLLGLDFESYRDDLVAFMQAQPRYRDYDFTASNLRVLIDLLAVNGWKQGFYVNMDMAESFLDSAQRRASVISRAKDLNYVPRSSSSAQAVVNLTFTSSNATVVVQKGQTFSSAVDGRTLTFSVPDSFLLVGNSGSFSRQLTIMEGPYVSDQYVFNSQDETQKLVLTNPGADTSSLTVVVYEDSSTTGREFTRADTMLGLNEASRVFFLQLDPDGRYRIIFGDGIVGYQPKDGSLVVTDYRVSSGAAGNGAKRFTADFTPAGATGTVTDTVEVSTGGGDPDSIDAIKFYAPRHFQTQEKATGDDDYAEILMEQFPEILSVAVYGGETVSPPQFSRVFVAVDVSGTDRLSDSRSRAYYDFLKPRCPKTITPVLASPTYSYASVTSTVSYDDSLGTLSHDLVEGVVATAVIQFAAANLGKFGAPLRFSRLTTAIDAADTGIEGNDTTVLVYKKVPVPGVSTKQTVVDFGMQLHRSDHRTIASDGNSVFDADDYTLVTESYQLNGVSVFLTDDSLGSVVAVKETGSELQTIATVGTVDYSLGKIVLSGWVVDSFPLATIKLYARPAVKDLLVPKSTILKVEPGEVSVTVVSG